MAGGILVSEGGGVMHEGHCGAGGSECEEGEVDLHF